MIEQPGDSNPSKFSYLDDSHTLKTQRSCHMTYTSPVVHDLLREGFDRSPMFNGRIKSIGPRYCPSVEDKINRFAEKDRHQLFVEPEGWDTVEVYVNGFSTSLPEEVQFKALSAVVGFEKVKFFRPGYAIEYDFFQPTQLKHSLENKPETSLVSKLCLIFSNPRNSNTAWRPSLSQACFSQGKSTVLQAMKKRPHKASWLESTPTTMSYKKNLLFSAAKRLISAC